VVKSYCKQEKVLTVQTEVQPPEFQEVNKEFMEKCGTLGRVYRDRVCLRECILPGAEFVAGRCRTNTIVTPQRLLPPKEKAAPQEEYPIPAPVEEEEEKVEEKPKNEPEVPKTVKDRCKRTEYYSIRS